MFPTRSGLHEVVENCDGNGLKALKAILQRSHPAFGDEPTTLVTTYPKQKELSLLEYRMEFEDFLQMHAMVSGFPRELDRPGKLDVFIMHMKYCTGITFSALLEMKDVKLHFNTSTKAIICLKLSIQS